MQQWLFHKIPRLLLHLAMWLTVWLFFLYFFSYTATNEKFVFVFASSLLPITIPVTYTIAYYLVPSYLLKKKYLQFALYLAYTIIFSLFLIIIITFVNFIFLSDYDMNKMPLLTRNFLFVFILVYLVAGLVSFIKLIHFNFKAATEKSTLEKRLLAGQLELKNKELSLLKDQIHPHFLFNTLNTIYGAALKESKDTPGLILKLSNLLDYTLNQIDKPSVAILEEVSYIQSYIGLEQVRFKDTLQVTFEKDIQRDMQVPPMLFIAFIENAFKHGSIITGFLTVDIKLIVTEDSLIFSIKNTKLPKRAQKENHGLGLSNTKKRLEALYPNRHTLEYSDDKNLFSLNLKIDISQ